MGELLGGVAAYYPGGDGGPGSLPGPLNNNLLNGPNGLSPVSLVPPPPERVGDIRCILLQVWAKKGINQAPFEEVARAALPVPLNGAPDVPVPSKASVTVGTYSGAWTTIPTAPCPGNRLFQLHVPLIPSSTPEPTGDPTKLFGCVQVVLDADVAGRETVTLSLPGPCMFIPANTCQTPELPGTDHLFEMLEDLLGRDLPPPLPPIPGLPPGFPPPVPHALALRVTGFSGDFHGVLSPCGGHAVFSVRAPLLPPGPPALHGDPTAPARCLQVALGSHDAPLARASLPWYGALL